MVNAKEASPFVGKVVEGAVLGAYTFDRYKQEKDAFFAKDAELTIFAHPDHETDAEARKFFGPPPKYSAATERDYLTPWPASTAEKRLRERVKKLLAARSFS